MIEKPPIMKDTTSKQSGQETQTPTGEGENKED